MSFRTDLTQDKNGNTAYITEIIVDRSTFTGEKANNTQGTSSAYQSYPGNAAKNAYYRTSATDFKHSAHSVAG